MQFPKLKGKAIMAPMAGITNLPYRLLCKDYGAAAVVTEMVSSNALVQGNKPTMKIAQTTKEEEPVGLQLFGNNTEYIKQSAKLMQKDFDFIDINMGCSVRKIHKQGSGSYLMKDIKKTTELIEQTAKSISKPLTIKIRSGYNEVNAVELAIAAEKAGAAAITIHPRMADQGFSGQSDWNIIKNVKEALSIPVIGNGDIRTPEDAKRMLEETGCDYIMIGRAAMGNPFIFKAINHYLKTGELIEQSDEERIEDFFTYLKYCKKYDTLDFNDIRTKAMLFTKSMAGSTKHRNNLGAAKTIDTIKKLMSEYLKDSS